MPDKSDTLVREMREKMAVDEISKDIGSVFGEVAALGSGVRQLRSGISAIGGGTMGAVGPLSPLVIDLLKKSKN